MPEYTENDWKIFRSKIADWQESFMDRLNKEYIALLSEDGINASDKFWKLWDRIQKGKKDTGVVVDMRRSKLVENIISLIMEGAITENELDMFSADLQKCVRSWLDFYCDRYPDYNYDSESD